MEAKRRAAIKKFINEWSNQTRISEKSKAHSFWYALFRNVFCIDNPDEWLDFEKDVEGKTKNYIDIYIKQTRVLIEQKSSNKDLNKAIKQSDGEMLTPYEQARKYINDMNVLEHPLKVITCNFEKFCVYDMRNPNAAPEEILLKDLEKEYYRLEFLVDTQREHLSKEEQVSKDAGGIVGLIYDAFLNQYINKESEETLKSLNKLCVRLVFCLYAEDAGIFGEHDIFLNYMKQYPTKDMREALIKLFKVLDTEESKRDPYLNDDLKEFPYVNGGLFADENIEIPNFTEEIRELLLNEASANFDWSDISPTIFGAVFESTLNPKTRHDGGMHYTSIENIHKVIDPLFMNNLKKEFNEICCYKHEKTLKENLWNFQNKLANLTFFDPACGSGNFLTETYISLRKLENEIIDKLGGKNQTWLVSPIRVSIKQFYGIEINDFAVTVAKTALWIAESQMLKETENIINHDLKFLPLTSYSNILEGNALDINWEDLVNKKDLQYIMGNPPFVGKNYQSDKQKQDMKNVFGSNWNNIGELDYVSAWYKKAADFMKGTNIITALVSTNSITQGQQVPILWKPLFEQGIHINFAYRTFQWDSEANLKAHVHCVIIGFSYKNNTENLYFENKKINAKNINAYLVDADNVFITERSNPIQNVQKIRMGSMPNDNKGYLSNYTAKEKCDIVQQYPETEKFFKRFYGSDEFLSGTERWCLWLKGISPSEIKARPILEAVKCVREAREKSSRLETRVLAQVPYLFGEIRQPDTDYLIIPCHSSANREYIPIAYVKKDIICGNHNMLIPNASLYTFGILCSNVHMAWVKTVCGRIKSDYRYSNKIVYNNFPWCEATEIQKARIEATAKKIIDARNLYNECCLADLYGDIMPPELRKAHNENDKAVMEAYGFRYKSKNGKITELSETEIVTELFKTYQKLIEQMIK